MSELLVRPRQRRRRRRRHAGVGRLVLRRLRGVGAAEARRRARDRRARVLHRCDRRHRRSHRRVPRRRRPRDPFAARPTPPTCRPGRRSTWRRRRGEVGLCFAPGPERRRRRRACSPATRSTIETRGYGNAGAHVHPILMGDQPADVAAGLRGPDAGRALVQLPAAQARPRRDARGVVARGDLLPPRQPARGFALQRVYTTEGDLDETLAFGDGDTVLVPRGYHTVVGPARIRPLLPQRDGRSRRAPGPSPTTPITNGCCSHRAPPEGPIHAATATRLLDNYIGGAWTPVHLRRDAGRHEPRDRRDARARAAVVVGRPRRGGRRPRAPRCPRGARSARSRAPASCSTLRERLVARQEDLARSVTTEMGKTIADARAEVARMIEMVEARLRDPDDDAGPHARGRLAQHRRRDDPPAGRRVRRDRPVQLPGDGAVLVPAVRDRLRQHVRPQAVRAGAADAADRVRGARRARACPPASSTSSTAAARSSRGSSTIRASTPSRSSARPRWRRSSTRARRRPASACRRSAAPRTTWS